jgi:hypothetical protein
MKDLNRRVFMSILLSQGSVKARVKILKILAGSVHFDIRWFRTPL